MTKTHDPLMRFLARASKGAAPLSYAKGEIIFAQGDDANAVFYIQHGKIKLSTVSRRGKAGVVAMMSAGKFFGEGCIVGQVKRLMTATAVTSCAVTRIEKMAMVRLLHEERDLADLFIWFLINQSRQYEEELRSR